MKYIIILILFITNACFGQDEDSAWVNSDSTYIYKRYTNGCIDSFPVSIMFEPRNDYELGDEGGNTKVVYDKFYNVPSGLKDTIPKPKKKLHIKAGKAATNTKPLKLHSGTIPILKEEGAIYTDGIPQHGNNTLRFTTELNKETKIDTIPCLLLITDKKEFDYSVVAETFSIKGYMVRQGYSVIGYLDMDKNKMKNIIVWQAIQNK